MIVLVIIFQELDGLIDGKRSSGGPYLQDWPRNRNCNFDRSDRLGSRRFNYLSRDFRRIKSCGAKAGIQILKVP